MNRLRHLISIPLLALALIAGAAGQAVAAADNVAVVTNETDDSYAWKQAFKVTRVNQDTADVGNGAAAVASCARCRTAAVAVQIVLITRSASTITPTNLSIALNEQCETECATYAGAWQLVVTTGSPVHFTEAGNARIDAFKADLRALLAGASFGPDPLEIGAFNAEVRALIHNDLVPVVEREMVRAGGGSLVIDVDDSFAA